MEQTKVCKTCGQSLPVSAFHKNKTYRDGLCGSCAVCIRKKVAVWGASNKDRVAENKRRYAQKNVDHERERARIKSSKWRKENPSLAKQKYLEWASRNVGLLRSYNAKRRALAAQATPCWVDLKRMAEIYTLAQEWNSIWPDDPVHVDHIVPLNAKTVCGLHTDANLQILRAGVNIRKSNAIWPDMP
jgi:hypothetical protein